MEGQQDLVAPTKRSLGSACEGAMTGQPSSSDQLSPARNATSRRLPAATCALQSTNARLRPAPPIEHLSQLRGHAATPVYRHFRKQSHDYDLCMSTSAASETCGLHHTAIHQNHYQCANKSTARGQRACQQPTRKMHHEDTSPALFPYRR